MVKVGNSAKVRFEKHLGMGQMGKARRRLRVGSAGIGFAAATILIFGQAGAAHAPIVTTAASAPIHAAAVASLSLSAHNASPSKYSAEPFKKLKINTPGMAVRLTPTLDDSSYADLAMGPIRYRDGALKIPGRTSPVLQQESKSPEVLEVGHGVSVPTGLRMAEAFNEYPSDELASRAGTSNSFAALPLVSAAHAAPSDTIEAMGGPMTRMPVEGHILFEQNDDALNTEAQAKLDRLVGTLRTSHANMEVVAYGGKRASKSSDARRLALRRGLAVRSYLVSRGIDQSRISVRPMGGVRDDGPEARVDVFYASY